MKVLKLFLLFTLTTLATFAIAINSANAHQQAINQAASLAVSCAACHSTSGASANIIPSLAGRNGDDLYRRLRDFKTDKETSTTIMNRLAKGYSDAELRLLADFFAAQHE